ncbi:unnamed protein product [Auanema sp. JU1783]|nr:unnamed protein product [Auanema sp. JU1783]
MFLSGERIAWGLKLSATVSVLFVIRWLDPLFVLKTVLFVMKRFHLPPIFKGRMSALNCVRRASSRANTHIGKRDVVVASNCGKVKDMELELSQRVFTASLSRISHLSELVADLQAGE